MITKITKSATPAGYAIEVSRLPNGAHWNSLGSTAKRIAKSECIAEQQGLCAYCYRSININDSNIEHVKTKEKYPNLTFEYSNFVACCNSKNSCNLGRNSNNDLPVEPFDIAWEEFEVNYGGEILSTNNNLIKTFNQVNVFNGNLKLVAERHETISQQVRIAEGYIYKYKGKMEDSVLMELIKACFYSEESEKYRNFGPFIEMHFKSRNLID